MSYDFKVSNFKVLCVNDQVEKCEFDGWAISVK